jgi:hypothetical protein
MFWVLAIVVIFFLVKQPGGALPRTAANAGPTRPPNTEGGFGGGLFAGIGPNGQLWASLNLSTTAVPGGRPVGSDPATDALSAVIDLPPGGIS